jgi:hypothetical protein
MEKRRKMGKKIRKAEVKVDFDKAVEVSKAVLDMNEKGLAPFDQEGLFPDAIVPSGVEVGSLEHALRIFYGCGLDSMRRANEVYAVVKDLADNIGGLSNLHEVRESDLIRVLENRFGIGIQDAVDNPVETIIGNAHKLVEEYKGDPRNIRSGGVDKTTEALCKFRQIGIGKSALIMKNLVRFGMWDFSEYEIPIKVDRHVLRIALGTRIVDPVVEAIDIDWNGPLSKALFKAREVAIREGYYSREDFQTKGVDVVRGDRLRKPLKAVFQKVCQEERISAVDLDDSLWAVGSYLCGKNDALYCLGNCDVGCLDRFTSDNGACYFLIGADKRRNSEGLFDQKD